MAYFHKQIFTDSADAFKARMMIQCRIMAHAMSHGMSAKEWLSKYASKFPQIVVLS